MSYVKIISKVEKTLDIPPHMRGLFPNKERIVIYLQAGQPTSVPDYVAKYFTKNRPHVYRYANEPAPVENTPEEGNKEENKFDFDPVEFLELNYSRIEEAMQTLTQRKEILAIGNKLGLKGIFNQKNERIIERIIVDVKAKQKQQEELDKHKDAQ